MAHALVVYNPVAGTAADPDLWLGTVVHRLAEKYTTTVFPTTAKMKPSEIFSAIKDDIDLVVAAGGDGTIRFALSAVASSGLDVPVALLPLGTGNQLARNLGIYKESIFVDTLHESMNVAMNGRKLKIDLGLMNGEHFCVAAGCGPISDAILMPEAQDKANWKMLAYASSMIQSIALPPVVFKISLPDEVFQVSASGLFVTNVADLGVGTLSETADVTDGLLDLCILNPKEFGDYIELGFRFGGGFVGGKAPYYVKKVQAVTVEVMHRRGPLSQFQKIRHRLLSFVQPEVAPVTTSSATITAMIDGDEAGTTPMKIKVAPQAVTVLVPQQN
ncbi:MAG: diacylglycerol kinase family protein [Candidatus Obscuribacterales bacterium]|nr:diacylglycerol kinase family protein [Candidatus Obscuribacterales bacterium]